MLLCLQMSVLISAVSPTKLLKYPSCVELVACHPATLLCSISICFHITLHSILLRYPLLCLCTLLALKLDHIVTFIVLTDRPFSKMFHRTLLMVHFWAFGLFI